MAMIKLILIWATLIVATILIMAALGVSERLGVLVGTGMVFGAIAHISQSPYWRYLKSKELNQFSTSFGATSVPRPISEPQQASKLDTPAKRVWFLVLLSGVAVCLLTFVVYEANDNYLNFVDALASHRSRFSGYRVSMLIGAVLIAVGYLCAFHYEQTLGRLSSWVRNGGGTG